jgi:hypothetical protein
MATLVSELVKIEVKNAESAAAVASHRAAGVKAGMEIGEPVAAVMIADVVSCQNGCKLAIR